MNLKQLGKLREELAALRRSPQKASALERFAEKVGRIKVNRGKEPVWRSYFDNVPVVAIPHHGSRDIPRGTTKSILNQLEEDLDAWDEFLIRDDE